jgi:hypothetical protein
MCGVVKLITCVGACVCYECTVGGTVVGFLWPPVPLAVRVMFALNSIILLCM